MKVRRVAWIAAAVLVIAAAFLLWLLRTPPAATSLPTAASAPSDAAARAKPARARSAGRSAWGPLRVSPAEAGRSEDAGAAVFEGRVISWTSGAPIPGAELTFARDGVTSRARSGDDGAFRFSPAAPGDYELVLATATDYLPFAPAWGDSPIRWTARLGERVHGATITLIPAVSYTGKVLSPDGAPVEGADVRIYTEDGGDAALVPTDDRAVSGANGEFRFSAPDGALLEARHAPFSPARARLDFSAQVSHTITLRFAKQQGEATMAQGRISGRVVDAEGVPVEGALVTALPVEPVAPLERRLRPHPSTRSDVDGRFTIEDLAEARYDLVASRRELAPARADGVPVGADGVTLTLTGGGMLRGTVRDADSGAAIPSFTVAIWSRVGPLAREPFTRRTFFDPRGTYEIRGLPPGEFLVMAIASAHAPSTEAAVTFPDPPDDPITADFSLGHGSRVTGTVIDGDTRAPIEGARISVEGLAGGAASGEPLQATAETDATGHFELAGLAAGLRSITAAAAGHHGRLVSGLVANEGGDIGPITIALTPTKDGEEPRIELTGIGAVLAIKGDALSIEKVIPGGGAEEAGLAPGDLVVSIAGVPVTDLGFEGSIQRIRGPEDSVVRLSVKKAGAGDPTDIAVRRRRIRS